MRIQRKIRVIIFAGILAATAWLGNGCNSVHYGFRDISIPDSINIVKVNVFENRASYVNTQLTPQLTDRLRQKIVNQTRLRQTSGDDADWEISGTITDYSFSTSGVSNNQSASNRISVGVHIVRTDVKSGITKEYDVSRNFDFPSSQSLQQAEASLLNDMLRGLTDDIFNRLFSDW